MQPGTATDTPPVPALESLSVRALRGVGPAVARKLDVLGIASVADLLFHLPLRYQDRTRVTPIAELRQGVETVIEGEVTNARVEFGKRRSLACTLRDDSGCLTLRFFHFSAAQQKHLEATTRIRCFGEVRRGRAGLELYHPEYQSLGLDDEESQPATLTPVYPTTEGLHQKTWRMLTDQALTFLDRAALRELIPSGLPGTSVSLSTALRFLHRPPPGTDLEELSAAAHPYQRRLASEELLAHHLAMQRLRRHARGQPAPAMDALSSSGDRLLAALPFRPTAAQQRVGEVIRSDLARSVPMQRLVQGDVGCGKTLVATLAALQAIDNGWQVAFMAPTELLVEQHFRNLDGWLQPLGINSVTLSSRQSAAERRVALEGLADGTAQLGIGTHALFQGDTNFARLGLVIIDEQHRFGVHQRLALREKGRLGDLMPHQLVMTATPIPRTLAMTAYADLDHSIIDELPPGRTPVTTAVIGNTRRHQVLERVRHACAEGRQAYWVCTLIEESDLLEAQAAEAGAAELRALLPELRIEMVHGRVPARQRIETMAAFKAGAIDLLVATTVIEVGVDVPNASLMIIENAERLGLAQLHQLRGRVGRGSAASHCVLLYQAPLSQAGRARLHAMRDTNDGFVLAERDLQLRGPGEMLGTRQTGVLSFRYADIQRDAALLPALRRTAERLLRDHPDLVDPLIERWMPGRVQYADA